MPPPQLPRASPGVCCRQRARAPQQSAQTVLPRTHRAPRRENPQGSWVTADELEECRAPRLAPRSVVASLHTPPTSWGAEDTRPCVAAPSGGIDTDGGHGPPPCLLCPGSRLLPAPLHPRQPRGGGGLAQHFFPSGRPLAHVLDVTSGITQTPRLLSPTRPCPWIPQPCPAPSTAPEGDRKGAGWGGSPRGGTLEAMLGSQMPQDRVGQLPPWELRAQSLVPGARWHCKGKARI